jgi:transposase
LDAERLARLARVDTKLLHPIQHRGGTAQADRALLRSRNALVECRTKLINHARGIVKSIGGRLPSCSTTCFHKRVRQDLPDELKPALMPVLDTLASLTKKIQCLEARIEHLANKRYPETGLLRQVSGVGPLTSFSFVLTLEDPERFKHSRAVGPYLGLRPRQSQSGEQDPELRITKAGDTDLRRLLVGSAPPISAAGDSPWQHVGRRTRRSVPWSPLHESSRCCCTGCGSRPRFTNLFGTTNPQSSRKRFRHEASENDRRLGRILKAATMRSSA